MTQLAIFSTPKPFTTPHISLIQKNAIMSWKSLGRSVEIWLVGDEEGFSQVSQECSIGWIPEVSRNSYGTPRIDSIFAAVREKSQAPYLCYVNADILLFPDLLTTLELVTRQSRKFLLIGQRWDINIQEPLDINDEWQQRFLQVLNQKAKLHKPAGSDYFVFPCEHFQEIPPFALGRAGWDNWMIFHARQKKLEVIDATGAITAVHQNHDFGHLPSGKIHRRQPESMENMRLAGGRETIFTLHDTNRVISDGVVTKPRVTRQRLLRELSIFPIIQMKPSWVSRLLYRLLNPRQAILDRKKDRKMKANIDRTLEEKK